MYDIITFGSAAQDIFLKSKAFKILNDNKDFATGQGICLPFGSKIDIEDIKFELINNKSIIKPPIPGKHNENFMNTYKLEFTP